MMTASNIAFIPFEFDKELQTLWRGMATAGKNFAYHARLASLIHAESNFALNLDSLKVIDALLSAVKSDLANKNVSEGRVLANDDFARLIMVLTYHVVVVISRELSVLTPRPTLSLYTAQGFSRVYARLFAGMGTSTSTELTTDELDAFYDGLGILCQRVGVSGQAVADKFFILPVIGARLFGTIDRTFYATLDVHGQKVGVAEDSLYWAVRDFIENFKKSLVSATADDSAKALFYEQTFSLNKKPQADTQNAKTVALQDKQSTSPPTQNTPPVAPKSTPPSAHKQKARASHTPKLFDEAYQDLANLSQPSDMVGEYQQAVAVLSKFDAFIDKVLASGKTMADLTFNDEQKIAQKQALTLLVNLVKQGNASAMLRLALYYFGGRGVGVDIAKAVMLTKRSAEMGDIRAQKLLSRLYYQGYESANGGVAMDMTMGEHWLRKSAEGGHPDAKKVVAYMNQVEMLKQDYRTEKVSDERYGLFFKALAVGTVLLFIILSIMW